MKYTDEIIKLDLIHYMGYNEQQADRLVELYRRNDELDALTAVIEAKKEACSRLADCDIRL